MHWRNVFNLSTLVKRVAFSTGVDGIVVRLTASGYAGEISGSLQSVSVAFVEAGAVIDRSRWSYIA